MHLYNVSELEAFVVVDIHQPGQVNILVRMLLAEQTIDAVGKLKIDDAITLRDELSAAIEKRRKEPTP